MGIYQHYLLDPFSCGVFKNEKRIIFKKVVFRLLKFSPHNVQLKLHFLPRGESRDSKRERE